MLISSISDRLLQRLDKNGDGKIDKSELMGVLQLAGLAASTASNSAETMLAQADTDSSKTFDKLELQNFFKAEFDKNGAEAATVCMEWYVTLCYYRRFFSLTNNFAPRF